jgi:hypothetical protein
MEMCPDAPHFIDYLRDWFKGARAPMNYLAISGGTALLALIALIVIAVVRAG